MEITKKNIKKVEAVLLTKSENEALLTALTETDAPKEEDLADLVALKVADHVKSAKHDLIAFIESMKFKKRATPEDIKIMYALYKQYTGRIETNLNCDACVIRVFTALKKMV